MSDTGDLRSIPHHVYKYYTFKQLDFFNKFIVTPAQFLYNNKLQYVSINFQFWYFRNFYRIM
jgi:hypothetical protein